MAWLHHAQACVSTLNTERIFLFKDFKLQLGTNIPSSQAGLNRGHHLRGKVHATRLTSAPCEGQKHSPGSGRKKSVIKQMGNWGVERLWPPQPVTLWVRPPCGSRSPACGCSKLCKLPRGTCTTTPRTHIEGSSAQQGWC